MIEAVLFDIAGTTVDDGSRAPVDAFVELFARRGITVTEGQAREPMGTHKREHIRLMCEMAPIAAAWRERSGRTPSDADVDELYAALTPLAIERIEHFADPIRGVPELFAALRRRGIRIGATTGYNRAMLEGLLRVAISRGFDPDVAIAVDDVALGRPAPHMCWAAAMRLGVGRAATCVNVGDTLVDVEAGRNAGMWSVGVVKTGNLAGDPRAAQRLREAGAHMVIDRAPDLLEVLPHLERRAAQGIRP